ncbi:hypothetical protein ACYE2N_06690 [Flavobacterium sp. MAHUQ-51]|uniref:hypothetical protein n=1 Tax=Flavobacterium sp. GCM10022190 TaxID=3252639 RepID=UPI00361B69A2
MKIIARLFLFLFIAFLLTPLIVSFVEKGASTSIILKMSEEEQVKKEVKDKAFYTTIQPLFEQKTIISRTISFFKKVLKHNIVSKKIFVPPPNWA